MAHPRWVGRYEEWVDYHSDLMFAEPHSSKLREDMVAWALQTDAETLTVRLHADLDLVDEDEAREALANLSCPVLVIHGTEDNCQPVERGRAVAEVTGGRLVEVEGAGHVPHGRHPVLVNTLIKEFVDMHAPSTTASISPAPTPWLFARERKRRALWVCSPIGLGHVLRDVAIARALRERVPDLEIEWLAQSPVTEVLATHGEIVHPASVELASESAHWESESTHHDLHAFYAFRRMDEILCANYMLFDDVVRETSYDLWVGDESWDVDHFLHENPERKIAPYAFLTDVVGFLPVEPEKDPREVELCTDYNAEMIEHRERLPLRPGPVGVHRRVRRAPGRLARRRPADGARPHPAVVHQRALRRAVRPGGLPAAGAAAPRARLRHRLPALRRRGRVAPPSGGTCSS